MFSLFGGSPVVKRKSVRRKATKRKATKRKATRRKSVRRKATRRKAQKKRVAKGRKRFVYGGSPEGNEDKITKLKQEKEEYEKKLAEEEEKHEKLLEVEKQKYLRRFSNEEAYLLANMQSRFSQARITDIKDSIKLLEKEINRLENPGDDDDEYVI